MKKTVFLSHFVLSVIVTIVCGLIYVSVQQAHRSAADDPQLETALEIKNEIQNNRSIEKWMTNDSIDLSSSLSPFKVLYDTNGDPVQSTALLEGSFPKLPKGIFDFTRKNEEDVFSWQPQRGIRMAMVVEHVKSPDIAFVAVGRSLKETEKRESNLTMMILIGWISCLVVIGFHWTWSMLNNRNISSSK